MSGAWLIVEDEALVAMSIEDAMTEIGLEIAGCYGRIGRALPVAEATPLQGAVLDVNVAGERIDPIAAALQRRGIPFVFVTGYGEEGVAAPFNHHPVVTKPFDPASLQAALRAVIAAA